MSRIKTKYARIIEDYVFEGKSLEDLASDAIISNALQSGDLTIDQYRNKVARMKALYGHPIEKRRHFFNTIKAANWQNKVIHAYEPFGGGTRRRPGAMTKILNEHADHIGKGSTVQTCRKSHGDCVEVLENMFIIREKFGKEFDGIGDGFNVGDADVYGPNCLVRMMEANLLGILDPKESILFVSSMRVANRLPPHLRAKNYAKYFPGEIPSHQQVQAYIHAKADEAGMSCELLAEEFMPNDVRDDDARFSFLLKAK